MDVLRLSNRSAVARAMTLRGYEVDGETLNRWVRTEAEVPEKAARYIREIFGITKTAPAEAGAVEEIAVLAARKAVMQLVPERVLERLPLMMERIEAFLQQAGEADAEGSESQDRVE